MEITIDNFFTHLPLIKESIEKAEFISIDTEFSGHCALPDDRGHDYDTIEERYQKLKFICKQFLAFQIGICTFHWDDTNKRYKCRPFSFYVFPKSKINDHTMMFQASAVNFLIQNNFDFNKLFGQAIGFAPLSSKKDLEQDCYYKVTKTFPSMRSYTSLSTTHQKKLDDMMQKINDWVYDPTSDDKLVFEITSYSLKKALSKEISKIYLNTGIFTDYVREKPETIIKKSKTFKQGNFIKGYHPVDETSQSTLGFLELDEEMRDENSGGPAKNSGKEEEKIPQEEKGGLGLINTSVPSKPQNTSAAQNQSQQQEIQDLFLQELGFSQIIELMINSKKPLVGHNMIYDLGFIYNQFIDALPDNYLEFTKFWTEKFPSLYDTKVLSVATGAFGKTELSHLHWKCVNDKKLNNNVQVEFDKERDQVFGHYEQTGGQGHDGGFDAYMTGHVYVCLCKYIEIGKIVNSKEKVSEKQTPDKKRKNKKQSQESTQQQKQEEFSQPLKKKRHYSSCQNQKVSYEDVREYMNKVMLSMDVPRYFCLNNQLTPLEVEYEKRLVEQVVYVKFKGNLTVQRIAELFNVYGDLNIVKNSDKSAYVDFSFIDKDVVKSGLVKDIITKIKSDKKAMPYILNIVPYLEAERFNCNEQPAYIIN